MDATSPKAFAARLQLLVSLNAGGNVRSAARRIGISHPALLALLRGNASPRAGTLAKIADAYQVSRGWLLDGEGDGPNSELSSRSEASAAWDELVYDLDLGMQATLVMLNFPTLTDVVTNLFVSPDLMRLDPNQGDTELDRRYRSIGGEVRRASDEERTAWTRLFQRWIDVAGAAHVRKVILKHLDGFRSREFRVNGENGRSGLAEALQELAVKGWYESKARRRDRGSKARPQVSKRGAKAARGRQ